MKPAAFFFDLDGTLVDTEEPWARAMAAWITSRGGVATLEEIDRLSFGRSWPDIHATLHRKYPMLGLSSRDEDACALRPFFEAVVTNPAQLVIHSSVQFFREVAKLAPCVIVSGSPHAAVMQAAVTCGLIDVVSFVLGGEDYARGKPAPDGFLLAAEKLDVDASHCVVIEDSEAGVAAGCAAGMRVIGLDRSRTCPQNLTGCEWLVQDLAEFDVQAVFTDDAVSD